MKIPRNRTTITFILWASLLLLALYPVRSAANILTLAWDPNREYDLAGYKIYFGIQSGDYDSVIDVGNITQYTVTDLDPETQYYLALTAYDTSYNESEFSEEVSGLSNPEQSTLSPSYMVIDSEEEDSGWGCFVATAAYGSYLNPHVKILREFRDKLLISNFPGRKFVDLYYQYGPFIATHIEKYAFLRFLTRQALLPLTGMSSLLLKIKASQQLLLLPLCALLFFTIMLRSYFCNTISTNLSSLKETALTFILGSPEETVLSNSKSFGTKQPQHGKKLA